MKGTRIFQALLILLAIVIVIWAYKTQPENVEEVYKTASGIVLLVGLTFVMETVE